MKAQLKSTRGRWSKDRYLSEIGRYQRVGFEFDEKGVITREPIIEINTIEELVSLHNTLGCELIIYTRTQGEGVALVIEAYDDYRE